MRFRVLRGLHSHGGRTYEPGEVVETDVDLVLLHNVPYGRKFERLDDAPAEQPKPKPTKAKPKQGKTEALADQSKDWD